MNIEELSSKTNNKTITVTFTYEEVRDMANGFYYLFSGKECDKDKYKDIRAKSSFLFDMIKHGNIQNNTVKYLSELEERDENEF